MKNLFFLCILTLVFTTNAYSQDDDPETYGSYDPSVEVNPPSGSADVCEGRRKDIYDDFDNDQRELLAQLILDYLTSELSSMPYDSTTDHPFLKYEIIAAHSDYGNLTVSGATTGSGVWHSDNEFFFSWHRNYIQGLEQYLLDMGYPEFVPLPGWNPNTSIPTEFEDAVVQEVLDTPLNGTPMSLGTITNGQLQMYEVIDTISCDAFQTMEEFATFIRGDVNRVGGNTTHNQVHTAIGGAMSRVPTASAAAIFWLFHAHVDELYYCYQSRCEECEPAIVHVQQSTNDCTICFDFSLSEEVNTTTIMINDKNGNQVTPPLDANGCIANAWRSANLTPGQAVSISITGTNACSSDDLTVDAVMPSTFGVETNNGTALAFCDQSSQNRIAPNPFPGGNVVITVFNPGPNDDVTIIHHDVLFGTSETITQSAFIGEGEEIQILPNADNWSVGNHVIQFIFGEYSYSEMIMKL